MVTDDNKLTRKQLPMEIGSTGLKQSGGLVYEEFLPKLQGERGVRVFREMVDNSSAIGAIRHLIRSLVRHAEWKVEPATDKPPAKAEAEFIETAMTDMEESFDDFISEALTCLDFGWAYHEIIYKLRKGDTGRPETNSAYNDGRWGWRSMPLRGQDSLQNWEIERESGKILGMWQLDTWANKGLVMIPEAKAIHFRTESIKNNPEGKSIFRNSVIDWFYLKQIQKLEAIGIERDMTGVIQMEVPVELLSPSAPAELKAIRSELETMLGQLKRDEREYVMVPTELDKNGMPTGYRFRLAASPGRRQHDTTAVKSYYRGNIMIASLAQFLLLGQQQTAGSFALASSQTNLFSVALGSVLDIIAETHTKQGIHPLEKLNGVKRDLWPRLTHSDIETPPLDEVAKYLSALAGAGVDLTSDSIQRKLLEFGNLPTDGVG
jgi:hypothetical protein